VRTALVAAAALMAARLALAQEPEGGRERERGEKVEGAIEYPAPAPEMRPVSVLVGRWEGEQTWAEPLRYKRGRYEGYPGPEGHVVRTVEAGPGGFSIVWTDDGRGPMGSYTVRAVLAWDPERRVYVLDTVHSLFPGVTRMTGGFEKGSLVLRGADPQTGEKRAARLVLAGLSGTGWTETLDGEKPVVTTVFRADATNAR
jgi:hypothetical protein